MLSLTLFGSRIQNSVERMTQSNLSLGATQRWAPHFNIRLLPISMQLIYSKFTTPSLPPGCLPLPMCSLSATLS